MTAFENLSAAQKLRASLHRDVRATCTEALHLLGMEMTKPAMEIVAELVYRKLLTYGTDLEAFAKHAKRNTVNSEDVKLLVRRNSSLKYHGGPAGKYTPQQDHKEKTHLNKIQPANPPAKDKRRKTVAATKLTTPVSKPKETGPNSAGDKTEDKEVGKEHVIREEEGKVLGEKEQNSRSEESMENRASDVEHMSVDDAIVDLTFD